MKDRALTVPLPPADPADDLADVIALLEESALDRTGHAVARLRRVLAYVEALRTK